MAAVVCNRVFVISIILFSISTSVNLGQTTDSMTTPLDVILLIDSSPSNESTDPNNLRISAARFLLDYLEMFSQSLGVNYRAGVANFGGTLGEVVPLRLLQDGMVREALRAEKIPFTDFRPPLDFALREFRARGFGTGNAMAVILFTDGLPQLTNQPLSSIDKTRYFKGDTFQDDTRPSYKLNRLIGDLQSASVKLFVVTVGSSLANAQHWNTLIPSSHCRSINSTAGLADVYHNFLADLIGAVTINPQLLKAGESGLVAIPPYVEQAVISVIKTNLGAHTRLVDPSGDVINPDLTDLSQQLHEIYVLPNPSEGAWKVQASQGDVQILQSFYPSRLILDVPNNLQVIGRPINLRARVMRGQIPVVDPLLHLHAHLAISPDSLMLSDTFRNMENGIYELELSDLNKEGKYKVAVTAELNGKPLEIKGVHVNFELISLPRSSLSKWLWWLVTVLVLLLAGGITYYKVKIRPREEETKPLVEAEELRHKALEQLKKHDENAAKQCFDRALDAALLFPGKASDRTKDLVRSILGDMLGKLYTGKLDQQRTLIYAKLNSEASAAQIRGLAGVLLDRWVTVPSNMVEEFYGVVRQPNGIEAMDALSNTPLRPEWNDEQKQRGEHLLQLAGAACRFGNRVKAMS